MNLPDWSAAEDSWARTARKEYRVPIGCRALSSCSTRCPLSAPDGQLRRPQPENTAPQSRFLPWRTCQLQLLKSCPRKTTYLVGIKPRNVFGPGPEVRIETAAEHPVDVDQVFILPQTEFKMLSNRLNKPFVNSNKTSATPSFWSSVPKETSGVGWYRNTATSRQIANQSSLLSAQLRQLTQLRS